MSEAKIAPRKVSTVEKLVDGLENHKTIGLVQMESIGAKTVQKLRADLRGRAQIMVAKNTLMRKAIEVANVSGVEQLTDKISGPVAFLFTNDSPFQIANYLEKNKVKAAAKAGQIAPRPVIVPKMNTGFPPGTIISELNAVGLPTRIEAGTVAIPDDTQVIDTGDRISTTLASILTRLGIEPFEVGLSLDLVLESGEIIERSGLLVDFDEYRNLLIAAHQQAVNLSVNAGILTDVTAPIVISNAQQKALALAATIGYISEDSAAVVFGRALAQASALARAVMRIDSSALSEEALALASAVPVTSSSHSASTTETVAEEEDDDEEEEEGEEVGDDGLGSLFG